MPARRRLLIASLSFIERDPRVLRQITELSPDWETTVCGYGVFDREGVAFLPLEHSPRTATQRAVASMQVLLGRNDAEYWRPQGPGDRVRRAILACPPYELIIANDLDILPAVLASAGKAAVLADAHEYTPDQFGGHRPRATLLRRFGSWLTDEHLPRADAVMTVCDGIADEFVHRLAIRRPTVVYNTPPLVPLQPRPTLGHPIELVHHGVASRDRGLRQLTEAVGLLGEGYRLNLMLVPGDPGYLEDLRRRCAGRTDVVFHDPVPTSMISESINRFDVGVFLQPPGSLSGRLVLPNKFFEFIQGRLAIAVGPSPEMARLVRHHDLGVVSADFTTRSFASALATLDPRRVDHHKHASDRAAPVLSWNSSARRLREAVDLALSTGRRSGPRYD